MRATISEARQGRCIAPRSEILPRKSGWWKSIRTGLGYNCAKRRTPVLRIRCYRTAHMAHLENWKKSQPWKTVREFIPGDMDLQQNRKRFWCSLESRKAIWISWQKRSTRDFSYKNLGKLRVLSKNLIIMHKWEERLAEVQFCKLFYWSKSVDIPF